VAVLPLGAFELLAVDLLPHVPLDEPDRRNLVIDDYLIDCLTWSRPILPSTAGDGIGNPRFSRNRMTCRGHQPWHIPQQKQAVNRPDLAASRDRRVGLRSHGGASSDRKVAKPHEVLQAGAARLRPDRKVPPWALFSGPKGRPASEAHTEPRSESKITAPFPQPLGGMRHAR
jgi:hypothetical protein